MNDSDLCQIVCPCCEALITIDDAGDVSYEEAELAELAPNEFRGLAGLVSVDATPQWRAEEYKYNQQGQELIVPTFTAHAEEECEIPDETPNSLDPAIEEAIQTDLSKRNIKNKTKTTNWN